jgi:hypothetical protein
MNPLPMPRDLSRWFTDPVSQVGYYYSQAQRLIALNHLWKQQADLPFIAHSTIANFQDTTLVIAVDRSEWATHLHYAKFELIDRLKSWPGLESLLDIKWYIDSPAHPPQKAAPLPSRLTLSKENKQLLESVVATVAHPSLKAALRQLTQA